MDSPNPYFVSPVDGHWHSSEQGRNECAVCAARAERDRLRADLDATTAENDRFVAALREILSVLSTESGPLAGRLMGIVEHAFDVSEAGNPLRDDVEIGDVSLLLERIEELTVELARAQFALGTDGPITADDFPDAIGRVIAERDRLRAEGEALHDWGHECERVGRAWEMRANEAEAERNRLRDVVDADRRAMALMERDDVLLDDPEMVEAWETYREVNRKLDGHEVAPSPLQADVGREATDG